MTVVHYAFYPHESAALNGSLVDHGAFAAVLGYLCSYQKADSLNLSFYPDNAPD